MSYFIVTEVIKYTTIKTQISQSTHKSIENHQGMYALYKLCCLIIISHMCFLLCELIQTFEFVVVVQCTCDQYIDCFDRTQLVKQNIPKQGYVAPTFKSYFTTQIIWS